MEPETFSLDVFDEDEREIPPEISLHSMERRTHYKLHPDQEEEKEEEKKHFFTGDVKNYNVFVAFKTYKGVYEEDKTLKMKIASFLWPMNMEYTHAEIILRVTCPVFAQEAHEEDEEAEAKCPCDFITLENPESSIHTQKYHYMTVRILEDKNNNGGSMHVSVKRTLASNKRGGTWNYALSQVDDSQIEAAISIIRSQIECKYNYWGMYVSFMPFLGWVFPCVPTGATFEMSRGFLRKKLQSIDHELESIYRNQSGVMVPRHYFHYTNNWFCSEFVTAILLSCSMINTKKFGRSQRIDPWRFTPSKLADLIKNDPNWKFIHDALSFKELKKKQNMV